MRKQQTIVLLALLSVIFFSCTEKGPAIPTPKLTFSEEVDAGFESITLSCAVSGNVSAERLIIEYSKDKSMASAQKKSFEKTGDSFTITITNLEIQTTYYYRYTVENKASVYSEDNIRQFKTLDYVVPEVTTVGVKDISGTTATLEGKVDFACSKPIIEQGFRISKDNNNYEALAADLGSFTLKVEGLEFETTYYFQAYAKTEIGTGYGEVKELKTCNAVSFKTVEVNNITATSAVVSGGVEDNGGITIDRQGFRYSDDSSEDFSFVESTGAASLSNLKSNTSYRVWYYAKTVDGEFESEEMVFSTTDGNISFGECVLTDKNTESISLSTTINGDGGSEIIRRGFVYDSNTAPTLEDHYILVSGTIGNMIGTINELSNNTVYHIRAFAENEVGVQYGSETAISTMSGVAEMGKTSISDITADSAKLTSDIVSSNGTAVLSCGFCYNLGGSPTTSDDLVESSSVAESISVLVNQLKANTKYYVRSFATTKYGTSYGPENSFTTKNGEVTFTNLSISELQPESATANVTIFDNGGSSIQERGFCYSTNENPTVSSNTVTAYSAEASYSSVLSALSRSTKYYYRAYAKNKIGIYYSVQDDFTTPSGMATLGALSATTVESTSATLSCEVMSDGGATVSERGFCFATTPTPTVGSSKNAVSGTVGSMQGDITGLEPDTKYYVRAYATTQYGTVYSNEVQITTKLGLPKLFPVTVSDIKPTSATLLSGIASEGDGEILDKGFCYSTTDAPTINDKVVHIDNFWTASISNLEQNTTYYVRSFATTQYGTAYSESICFKTTYYPVDFGALSLIKVGFFDLSVLCAVSSYGENDVIEEGFCFSTNPSASVSDSKYIVADNQATLTINNLAKGTTYYIRRYVVNRIGVFYSEELEASTLFAPDNTIYGIYSVSDTKKVVFAKSNLQQISDDEIGFLPEQYTAYGSKNLINGAKTYPTDIFSHFYVQSADEKRYPNNTQSPPPYHVLGEYWSVLTITEWEYLINGRANAESLFFYNVTVGDVSGVLLLPDDELSLSASIDTGVTLSIPDFKEMEKQGVVFIPYSGYISFGYNYYLERYLYTIEGWGNQAMILAYEDYSIQYTPSPWDVTAYVMFYKDYYSTNSSKDVQIDGSVRLVYTL